MRTECTHCNAEITSGATRMTHWISEGGAYCDGLKFDCPLCGEIGFDSVRMVPESPEDADFLNPERAIAMIAGVLS